MNNEAFANTSFSKVYYYGSSEPFCGSHVFPKHQKLEFASYDHDVFCGIKLRLNGLEIAMIVIGCITIAIVAFVIVGIVMIRKKRIRDHNNNLQINYDALLQHHSPPLNN